MSKVNFWTSAASCAASHDMAHRVNHSCQNTSRPEEPTSNFLELLYADFARDLLELLGQRLLPIPKREVAGDIGCDLQLLL